MNPQEYGALEFEQSLLRSQVAQHKALFGVIAKIRESLDLDSIFKSTAIEVRQLLNADRVAVYRFEEESGYKRGEVISEAVLPEFNSALATKINDHCFGEKYVNFYPQGRIWSCPDIHNQGLADCYIQTLVYFQIRANLVVPLLKGEHLWGLLSIHQCSAPRQWQDSEIEFVSQIASHLDIALQHAEFVSQLQTQSEHLTNAVSQAVGREKAIAAIINKIRRSLDIDTIFSTTTAEVRQLLKADRVVIYRFNPDWSGKFIVESMTEGWISLVSNQLNNHEFNSDINDCTLEYFNVLTNDTYLQETQGGEFIKGELFRVRDDIYAMEFSSCYFEALERIQARAYIIVPIYNGKKLWGLLATFQNSDVRHWQESEINFLVQISSQLGVTIQQAEMFGKIQKRSTELQTTLEAQLQERADELAREAARERALTQVIEHIRQTIDIDTIFRSTTQEVRQILDCDRVVVYRFFADWSGEFVFESKDENCLRPLNPVVDFIWEDTHLQETEGGRYRNHENSAIDNIYEAGLMDCHIAMLELYQVMAFIVVPVFVGDKLWGLLAAYQSAEPRHWESREISLLAQVGNQLGVAVQQAELIEQLKKAKEKADAANHAKSNFLAHMSHELRSPLNAILGFTQLLARDTLTQYQKEKLAIIGRSGEHLLTLLNDVLEMSKIETGSIVLNISSFDIYRLLESLKEMFQLKAASKNLELIFEYDVNVPRYIQADDSKLRQILINLLGNAIKFTEVGSVILRVSTKSQRLPEDIIDYDLANDFLYFEVEDTGHGIAQEELSLLFEAFVQTEAGRKSQEGSGLGLLISKRFVNLMGGEIGVESKLGQGTRFSFGVQIHLVKEENVPLPRFVQNPIGLEPNQPSYRILVVDDKWASRRIIRELITSLGFEVQEAENGQEALEVWQRWQPDLIWMDMQMPILNGYEATKSIRALESESPGSHCKILALTANVLDEQRSISLSVGCDDFISKPLNAEIIFTKMSEHLGVKYIYDEAMLPLIASSQVKGDHNQLQSEDLAGMPLEWLNQLYFAAIGADDEQIFNLLDEIALGNSSLADELRNLTNNFQLERIVNLITPFIQSQQDDET